MSNTLWQITELPAAKVRKALGMFPQAMQSVLNKRGIYTEKTAEAFFNPSLDQLNPPELLFNMADAVKTIEEAIAKKEKVAIHGDFDVDGVTATAILLDYLKGQRGANVFAYIPHRVDEGYGLTEASLAEVAKLGAKLIISVDCGIRDAELVEKYQKKGIKLIITDHHEIRIEKGKPYLPDATAVLHPNHPKGKYPFKELSGAAVAWKLVCALENHKNSGKTIRSSSKKATRVSSTKLTETAKSYLDLVALATVCDVMPLQGENRVIVKEGLKQLKKTQREGLKALIKQTALSDKVFQAYQLGFVLGPRLNAAGRLASAMDALDLLTAEKEYDALVLAEQLEKLNQDRQALTIEAITEAEEMVEREKGSMLYYFSSDKWKDGIIGLVAGRMTEKYSRPVVVVRTLNDEAKGSARSIRSYNIVNAFSLGKKWLDRFGGHALAAGFSTTVKKEPYFKEELLTHANKALNEDLLIKTLPIDYRISGDEINFELTDYLEKLEPTGFGNPSPLFAFGPVTIIQVEPIGREKNHLKLFVRDLKTNKSFEAVWFEAPSFAFSLNRGDQVELVCSISRSVWNGRSKLELRIRDLRSLKVWPYACAWPTSRLKYDQHVEQDQI